MTEEEYQQQLQAALADKYEIESKLGEGGMAFVYLARDVKHDRLVAIKVMRPEFSAALGDDRFLREIQITAKQSHPNVLALYDSGAVNGFLYYVMPYIQGESLADLIEREKQLGIDEAVRIAREIGEALAHAHSYGLVHRDIKPDNIMLQSGHAIVADFGISRAVEEAGGEKLTQTGMAVGTPAYMAPEQSAGDPNVDGRADVYSLGCVLYEMLVGQIPFTGPSAQAIMARHTMDQVTPPTIMRDTIPPELEDIIFAAMAKLPADRFKTALEMVEALKAFESGAQPKVRKSTFATAARTGVYATHGGPAWKRFVVPVAVGVAVAVLGFVGYRMQASGGSAGLTCGDVGCRTVAVLYFDDLSADSSLGLVADGLTEGLIDRLSTVQALSVISRNGVVPWRGVTVDDLGPVVDELNAGTVVMGTVEPARDGFRVSTRLIDGESLTDVVRQSFTVAGTDVLTARDSVAGEVELQLRSWLGQEIQSREQRAAASSSAAWLLVQRAAQARADADALDHNDDRPAAMARLAEADTLLAQAEAEDPDWLDPTIERAWVAYRMARWTPGSNRMTAVDEGLARLEAAFGTAGNDPRLLEIRGHLRHLRWQVDPNRHSSQARVLLDQARDDLVAATERDATLARAYLELINVYYNLDDANLALRAAESALAADAFLANADRVMEGLFWGNLDNEVFPNARRWCDEGARRFPSQSVFTICRLWLMATPATSTVTTDSVAKAWTLVESLTGSLGGDLSAAPVVEAELATGAILAQAGLADSALAVLDNAHNRITSENDPSGVMLSVEAYMRSRANDADGAIDLLRRYVLANPDHGFEEHAGTQWYWRELRNHPRWTEITGGR